MATDPTRSAGMTDADLRAALLAAEHKLTRIREVVRSMEAGSEETYYIEIEEILDD